MNNFLTVSKLIDKLKDYDGDMLVLIGDVAWWGCAREVISHTAELYNGKKDEINKIDGVMIISYLPY